MWLEKSWAVHDAVPHEHTSTHHPWNHPWTNWCGLGGRVNGTKLMNGCKRMMDSPLLEALWTASPSLASTFMLGHPVAPVHPERKSGKDSTASKDASGWPFLFLSYTNWSTIENWNKNLTVQRESNGYSCSTVSIGSRVYGWTVGDQSNGDNININRLYGFIFLLLVLYIYSYYWTTF